jgi:hypothetical protein
MNTFKTVTGERVTLHGDHIAIEQTPIEDVVLAVYDDIDIDALCEGCGAPIDSILDERFCTECYVEARDQYADHLEYVHEQDWDRGVTYRDIYGED